MASPVEPYAQQARAHDLCRQATNLAANLCEPTHTPAKGGVFLAEILFAHERDMAFTEWIVQPAQLVQFPIILSHAVALG